MSAHQVSGRMVSLVSWPLLFSALVSILATGCGDPNLGHVTGQIMVDGKPAEQGAVILTPVDGNGQTGGAKILNGTYSLDINKGRYKVEIRVPTIVGKQKIYADDPNSPIQDVMAETLPDKYNNETELEIEIVPGANTHDFTDLKGLKKPKP